MTDMTATAPQYANLELELIHGECLANLRLIPDNSIDLIACDLPYGSIRCKWDVVIDMDAIWTEFRRILTDKGTVVATSAGLFTVDMINAARDLYKYNVIWHKSRPSQFVHSKNRPMVNHEDVLVFSKGTMQRASRSLRRMTYNPQGAESDGIKLHRRSKARAMGVCNSKSLGTPYEAMKNFPRTIQYHPNPARPFHPTQKPESLLEWIIASYSEEGDVVCDPTMGSGTAGVAAVKLGRAFIGIERDADYFQYAEARINAAVPVEEQPDDFPPEPTTPKLALVPAVPKPEPESEPTSRIIEGDCIDVMRTMEDNSFDLIVTSPPYNLGGGSIGTKNSLWPNAKLGSGYGSYADDMRRDEYVEWQKACLCEMWRLLSPTGAIFYNHKPRIQDGILQTPLELNPNLPVRQIVVWQRQGGINFNRSFFLPSHEWIVIFAKADFRLNAGHGEKDVWNFAPDRDNDHPAPFPLDLPLRAIGFTNARRILDPFSGSGTTGVASKLLGCDYTGIEIDPDYCAKSEGRIAATIVPSMAMAA